MSQPRGARQRFTSRGLDSRCVAGRAWLVVALAVFCIAQTEVRAARAGEWPQILGPQRNGKAQDEHLLKDFPATGPKTLWQRPVGSGFAGVAVVDGRVVLFHRVGNESIAEALDALTGKPLWKKGFPTSFSSPYSSDNGPRCVPLVYDGSVFLFGAAGDLHCLSLESGDVRWSRDVYAEYHAPQGYFGAGSSPIVDSGKLLLNVGGPGAGLVAFSLSDGKTLWKKTDEAASYSSPTAATIDGTRHVVFVTRLSVVSLDPANGNVRFRFPFGARGPTVNAANPLILGDNVFVSASYGVGAQWAKIGKDKAETVWQNDDTMSSQFATCVEHDGFLYGVDGRQDVGVARLRCFDPRSGKVLWTEEDFGTAHLILADDRLLIQKTDGHLILAEPSAKQYRPLASASLFDSTVQALPALSNGLFYARDTQTLKCFDLRRPSASRPGQEAK